MLADEKRQVARGGELEILCQRRLQAIARNHAPPIALETAEDLSNGAQSAIRWTKYALNNWLRVNGPIFDTSTALELLGFTGAEAREGLASHLEKRKPVFPQDCPI